eukprot:TRINITY_DN151_c0_g2_i1.p1 TRINITY_DN151_c0_g2~~TRINITY_DN151_c0_g2_i1.p1  ORF type:complete len:700 (+),score=133.78 TRINITY_DN151_c0_g2_i1:84-2183(+)
MITNGGESVILEALMTKRPQMKSRLALATGTRRRYFFLTTKRLYYYENNPKGCEKTALKGIVDLALVRIVERVAPDAIKCAFQINHESYYLYVIADSEVMATEWVNAIQDVVKNNLNLEHHFHPGVFEDSKWSCCGNKSKMATGCNPTFINPNKQQPPSRDTRSQLPPLPSTPNFPGRTEDQELIAKRSASNPASLNGAVGTEAFEINTMRGTGMRRDLPLPPAPNSFSTSKKESPAKDPIRSLPTPFFPETPKYDRKFEVVVQYDFSAPEEGDLAITKGEKLWILDNNREHWWKAENLRGEAGNIPSNYVQEIGLSNESWFVPSISRQQAEKLLEDDGHDGTFMIRTSSRANMYSLSIWHQNQCRHYHIKQNDNDLYYISDKYPFPSITDLVNYHKYNGGGLCCRPKRAPQGISPRDRKIFDETWEINPNDIDIIKQLDEGQFGIVYFARWRGTIDVAMKKIKESTSICEDDLLEEAEVMKHFSHPNLLRLYGIITEKPIRLITEYMIHGSLLSYLRETKSITTNIQVMLDMATQVAAAMGYLENICFIHRDLAARNCLVGDRYLVKVADFGLTRYVVDDTYTASEGSKFPIKWAAPEVINYARFSSKSDVWSYGILLWELFTGGNTPYKSFPTHQLMLEQILKGYRLEQPPTCPNHIYDIMFSCWLQNPDSRPSFSTVDRELRRHIRSDYTDTLIEN